MNIVAIDPHHPDATLLMNELSDTLEAITGASGRNSFQLDDATLPHALFAVAYHHDEPVGCGALRPLTPEVAEVKRMYARTRTKGIGTQLLAYLEEQARALGYTSLRLETRLVNTQAVAFYTKRGYERIPNYGKYVHMPEAVCFEKCLTR